jgi:hypothetical protein
MVLNQHGKRYSTRKKYVLNTHWDLLGIDHQDQIKINAGLAPRLWMPIPISIYIATVMKNYLCLMSRDDPGPFGSKQWKSALESVGKNAMVLDPTAGAGGSTIGLSAAFDHVFAGDFCPQQLNALRNNVVVVRENTNVTVDVEPIDVLTRRDIPKYDTMIISPFWGGSGYKQLEPGTVDLYLHHIFESSNFETQSVLNTGVSANQFIVNTMKQNPRLKFVTLLIPYNFNV